MLRKKEMCDLCNTFENLGSHYQLIIFHANLHETEDDALGQFS